MILFTIDDCNLKGIHKCTINQKNVEELIHKMQEMMRMKPVLFHEALSGNYEEIRRCAFFLYSDVDEVEEELGIMALKDNLPMVGSLDTSFPYVIEEKEDVDAEYILHVFCRFYEIPKMIMEGEVSGKHWLLREFTREDVPILFDLYEDQENVKFLPKLSSIEEEEKLWIAYEKNMYVFYEYGLWAVLVDGRMIGQIGLDHTDIGEETYVELGYHLAREYQRMGLATDICKRVLAFGKERGIEKIVARVEEKNLPSVKLAKKLGFTPWKEDSWMIQL